MLNFETSSGEEGKYPDLERTVETKIRSLNPNSRILRKDVPIVSKREIPKKDQAILDEEIEVRFSYFFFLNGMLFTSNYRNLSKAYRTWLKRFQRIS